MIDAKRRKRILSRGRPPVVWKGEPGLGGWYTEQEIKAAEKAIRKSMDWNVGFGFMVEEIVKFEEAFARYAGTEFAVSCVTASVGLDMAMMCLDLKRGDEVIIPACNFPASTLATLGQGGKVVFCEVDPRTFNADPADVERRITPRTRAICPVHMNGLSADMDALLKVARRHPHPKHGPLKVIGDAARACGGGYKGTKIGKKGWMTVFSFHTMKLITTLGEGGMVTTDDPAAAERLRAIRQWGAGKEWGTSYKLTMVQAAVGLVQLRRLDGMLAKRAQRAHERTKLLEGVPELTLPYEPPDCDHTFYLYTILVPPEWAGERRDRLTKMMHDDYHVACSIANPPVYYRDFIGRKTRGQRLPLSEELGKRLFCPSLHPLMTKAQNEYVAAALIESVERVKAE